MANINEPIIKTIDMMVDEKIKGLPYDKTIKCVVEDTSNKKNGEYIVSSGLYRFTAYSNSGIYSKNSSVYVTIPNGDFNERKIIIGKCKDETNVPFNYTSPFDKFISLTENYLQECKEVGLTANSEKTNSIVLFDSDVNLDITYNRLGISAQFRADLSKLKIISGNYGLEVKLTTDNGEKTLELNTLDMFGNLYSFNGYSLQEKVFDITNIANISHILVEFVEYNNFEDKNGYKPIEKSFIEDNNGKLIEKEIKNLFIKDLTLKLGYDLESLQEDKIFLYSYDKLSYKFENGGVEQKSLEMRWAHRKDDGSFVAIEDEEDFKNFTEASIYWYHQDLTKEYIEEENIPYIGSFWHHDTIYDNKFNYSFIPNADVQYEKFRVIISYQGNLYESNTLIFENENQVANPATIDLITRMKITCDDGSNGIYPFYNENNQLINSIEGNRMRKLTFSYTSKYTGDPLLDGAEKISWKIPKNNTMIQTPSEKNDKNTIFDETSDIEYYIITRNISNFNPEDEEERNIISSQNFKIKKYYDPWATNNTIYCVVTRNSIEYIAKIDLFFSIRGNSGTEYTFFITADQPALIMDDNEKITLSAHLLDYDNQLIVPFPLVKWKMLRSQKEYSNTTNELDIFYREIQKNNSDIIQASVTINDLILTSYYPIPLRLNKNYSGFEGVSTIVYDNTGSNPEYNKLPLTLKKNNQNLNNIHWVQSINKIIVDKPFKEQDEFLPRLKDNKIYPNKMYIENVNDQYSLIAQENDQSIWIQPIFIHMDKYGNSLLNQWDGQQKIDKEGNYILSNMVGAGYKENDNTFSGVLMGEVGNKKESPNFNIDQKNKMGLFGYNKGIQTFSLDTNGTATLGNSGVGQIKFDGAEGIIKSGNYQPIKENKLGSGMKIDLKNGFLDANGPAGSFNIDFSNSHIENNLLHLQGLDEQNNLKSLIKISDIQNKSPEYFIQTANYEHTHKDANTGKWILGTGARLDLRNSFLDIQKGYIGGWEIDYKGLAYKNINNFQNVSYKNLDQNRDWYIFTGKTYSDENMKKYNGYEIISHSSIHENDKHPKLFLKVDTTSTEYDDKGNSKPIIVSTEWVPVIYYSKANLDKTITYYNENHQIVSLDNDVYDKYTPEIYYYIENSQENISQYFGTELMDTPSSIAGSEQKKDWHLKIGDQFGVDRWGSVYMNNATIKDAFKLNGFNLVPKEVRLVTNVVVSGDTKKVVSSVYNGDGKTFNNIVSAYDDFRAAVKDIPSTATSHSHGHSIKGFDRKNITVPGRVTYNTTDVISKIHFDVSYTKLITLVAE